jgi:DNA repair protein RecN (Recombination protein N)
MLLHLSVQNYALIRQLEIDFVKGFTVITGETGAGKSILLGALNLMLGKRADTQVLFDNSKKCVVEGIFSIEKDHLKDFFEKNQLDYDEQLILRREIQVTGKSRAFINDTPVNSSLLKTVGENLIDIHSQHQTTALNDPEYQLNVIDSYGGLTEMVKDYNTRFLKYQNLKVRLNNLIEEENKSSNEKDFFNFLFSELKEAKLQNDEQELLEQELEILNHAEEIKAKLFSSSRLLGNDESGILLRLAEIRSNLDSVARFSQDYSEISDRIRSSHIELSDIFSHLEKKSESIIFSPERVNETIERLDLIYHLETKHRVNSVEELLNKKTEYSHKLENIDSLGEEIKKLSGEVENAESEIIKLAAGISVNRQKFFSEIESRIEEYLDGLGIPYARFKIQHSLVEVPGKDGVDAVKFLFNANKGGKLLDLAVVASGGELSRLMLAVKSLISKKSLLPSLIFDEIDIGVSGRIADKVGNLLSLLSESVQVIAITHLPQIAGKGNAHYFVYKVTDKNLPETKIREIESEERILEIAKMMSGEEVSSASVETARHLLKQVK